MCVVGWLGGWMHREQMTVQNCTVDDVSDVSDVSVSILPRKSWYDSYSAAIVRLTVLSMLLYHFLYWASLLDHPP